MGSKQSSILYSYCKNNNTPGALFEIHKFIQKKYILSNGKLQLKTFIKTKNILNYISYSHLTPLIWSCKNKMDEVALRLISTNLSNPDYITKQNTTALLFACQNNMNNVALALIATGYSNPDLASNNNITSLMLACKNNMNNVALVLIATGHSNPSKISTNAKMTALMYACKNKMCDVALAIIATGNSNCNYISKNNNSALKFARENNLDELINAINNEINNIN